MGQFIKVSRKSEHFHHFNGSEKCGRQHSYSFPCSCEMISVIVARLISLIWSDLRTRSKNGCHSQMSPVSLRSGAPTFCQYKAYILSGKAADDGSRWRQPTRLEEKRTLTRRRQPRRSPKIWQTRSGSEQAVRLPRDRWDNLATAEKGSRP